MTNSSKIIFNDIVADLRQSGIRSATERCKAIGGINLGQGVCDIPAQTVIKQAAADAIFGDKNLYGPYLGIPELREALAHKIENFNKIKVNPANEILVSHGSTGAYVSTIKALFNPGDEIILFEPFYGYHKMIAELFGVKIVGVPIDAKTYALDFDRLAAAITNKTRGIVICTPCNPSGKVFNKQELIRIGELAEKFNLVIITDEIYEYIVYPGYEHISIASLNNFKERTITLSGFSKTYNVTGWRLGYGYGPANLIEKISLVHDFLYICANTPLQYGMLAALQLDANYYSNMCADFLIKQRIMVSGLRDLGFIVHEPQGAYYLLADFRNLGFHDDEEAITALLENAKVAAVTGRSFYQQEESGRYELRFCFALSEEKINLALERLSGYLRR